MRRRIRPNNGLRPRLLPTNNGLRPRLLPCDPVSFPNNGLRPGLLPMRSLWILPPRHALPLPGVWRGADKGFNLSDGASSMGRVTCLD